MTSVHDVETIAVTNINEAVFVMSTKMKYKGPEAGVIFRGVLLKEEMRDTGKDAANETLEKYSLASGTEGGLICPGKTFLTSKPSFMSILLSSALHQ